MMFEIRILRKYFLILMVTTGHRVKVLRYHGAGFPTTVRFLDVIGDINTKGETPNAALPEKSDAQIVVPIDIIGSSL